MNPKLEKLRAEQERVQRDIPGSVAFGPSVVGLIIAGEVVKDLTQDCAREVTP